MTRSSSKKLQLATALSGALLCMLTQYLVTPALPAIMAHYSLTADVVQWLTSGFTMTCALMIPATAFLIQRLSPRRLFLIAMGLFSLGSLLLGTGTSFALALLGRFFQALGAGVMMPLVQVLLLGSASREKRGAAMGKMGLVIAMAPALGPVLAGLTVDRFAWYWLFRGVFLAAALILLAAWRTLPPAEGDRSASLDFFSLLLSCLGFGGLLYGFSIIAEVGFLSLSVMVSLAAGCAGLYFFIRRQKILEKPFLNLRVLKTPTYRRAVVLMMVANASLAGGTVLLPIYIQNVCGQSATASGLLMAPGAILMGLIAPISGRIYDKKGPRGLNLVGFSLLFLGNLTFCFLSPHWSLLLIGTLYSLRMIGMALNNSSLLTWAMHDLTEQLTPHGVSVMNSFRQVAGAFGTALMVTTLRLAEEAGGNTLTATTQGLGLAFALATVFSLFALILTLKPLPKTT